MVILGENFILIGAPTEHWVSYSMEQEAIKKLNRSFDLECSGDVFKALNDDAKIKRRQQHRQAVRKITSLLGFLLRQSGDDLYDNFAIDLENILIDQDFTDKKAIIKIKGRVKSMIAKEGMELFKDKVMKVHGVEARKMVMSLGFPVLEGNFGEVKSKGRKVTFLNGEFIIHEKVG